MQIQDVIRLAEDATNLIHKYNGSNLVSSFSNIVKIFTPMQEKKLIEMLENLSNAIQSILKPNELKKNSATMQGGTQTPPYENASAIAYKQDALQTQNSVTHSRKRRVTNTLSGEKILKMLGDETEEKYILANIETEKDLRNAAEAISLLKAMTGIHDSQIAIVHEASKKFFICLVGEKAMIEHNRKELTHKGVHTSFWQKDTLMERDTLLAEMFTKALSFCKSRYKKNTLHKHLDSIKAKDYDTLAKNLIIDMRAHVGPETGLNKYD